MVFGGVTLGIEMTIEDFRSVGIFPSLNDRLLISRITGARASANSFKTVFGMLPLPCTCREDNAL